MNDYRLNKILKVLLLIIMAVVVAYFGKPFLVPLIFAALLSMLLLPLVEKLVKKKWNKAVATVFAISLFLLSFATILFLLGWQVSQMTSETPQIEKKITTAISKAKQQVSAIFGLPAPKQEQMQPGTIANFITGFMTSIGSFLAHFVLVLVYVFLFIYYRTHLKNFILKMVPADQQSNTRAIIDDSREVAQKYLTGLSLMIACLWVMYGIGFSIAGVSNPIFFALLCGTLEIVPFVGNLVGSTLTAAFAVIETGNLSAAVGVLVVYGTVQFVQTYLLEPLVVGRGVNINPLSTIIGLVAGEILWGISGMVLAIPLLAIVKIICDHIEPLKPFGQLIGETREEKNKENHRFYRLLTGKKETKKP